jgi:hypothetical protein
MLVRENMEISGRAFVKQYSDGGFYIERDGAKYAEAIDPADIVREYTETGEPIESETELTVADTLGMLKEMGVDTDD